LELWLNLLAALPKNFDCPQSVAAIDKRVAIDNDWVLLAVGFY
jgi:hypothetical protein